MIAFIEEYWILILFTAPIICAAAWFIYDDYKSPPPDIFY